MIPLENGLRFLAAISKEAVQDFVDLVHAHMGPAAEPQLLIYEDIVPEERVFLSAKHLMPASPKHNRYYNAMIEKGKL